MSTSELALYKMAIMQAWNAVVITSADQASGYPVQIANPAFCDMTGYSLEELRGHSLKMLQGADTNPAVIARLRFCLQHGEYFVGKTTNYRKDGSSYVVRWNISAVRDETGIITHFVSVQQDLTDFERSQQRSLLLGRALDAAAEPIVLTDIEEKIVFANSAFSEVSGYALEEVIDKTPALWQSGQHNQDFYKNLRDALLNGLDFGAIFVNKKRDGSLYYSEQSISPILDEHGKITHYVSISKDVTERVKAEQVLVASATLDKLTGLHNRNHGEQLLKQAYINALTSELPLSLIMCDIDHFKQVNDHYGHPVGDTVLSGVAGILLQSVRNSDTAIRWGGEEFIILMNDCDQAPAIALAERIRASVECHHYAGAGPVTISLGQATLQANETMQQLIARCDAALYSAKNSGRNRLAVAPI